MFAGCIVIWSGAIVNIPAGYQICDGTNGTPDLRDRFVVGAGSTYNPGDTGGVTVHNHPWTIPLHTHTIGSGANIAAGGDYSNITDNGSGSGNTSNATVLPPYYALAYIMKL